MIGFPLTLPIEATEKRNFYLVKVQALTLPAGAHGDLDQDDFHQLKIDVTEQEHAALLEWLESRDPPYTPVDFNDLPAEVAE